MFDYPVCSERIGEPLKSYCMGLLLTGERKSVEPMAARLAPDNVGRMHQSLHHLVADAPWSDEEMLAQIRSSVLPAMQQQGPIVAWIIDDTGFPKKARIRWESRVSTAGNWGSKTTARWR